MSPVAHRTGLVERAFKPATSAFMPTFCPVFKPAYRNEPS